MFRKLIFIAVVSSLFVGCASVPMEPEAVSAKAKSFNSPSEGNAGLYIYRDSSVGGALKKDIWVDNKCVGESAPDVFFYEEVKGNKEHKISTESRSATGYVTPSQGFDCDVVQNIMPEFKRSRRVK